MTVDQGEVKRLLQEGFRSVTVTQIESWIEKHHMGDITSGTYPQAPQGCLGIAEYAHQKAGTLSVRYSDFSVFDKQPLIHIGDRRAFGVIGNDDAAAFLSVYPRTLTLVIEVYSTEEIELARGLCNSEAVVSSEKLVLVLTDDSDKTQALINSGIFAFCQMGELLGAMSQNNAGK